jgi:ferric-dicitrate binding protein FerR (iron transport regulator)
MSTKNTGERDPLEKIFLVGGRREPVDAARASAVERRTRERWQRMLARRRNAQRRRRFTWAVGGAALAASVMVAVILMSRQVNDAPMIATVVNLIGTPETGARGHAMTLLQNGAELRAGSVLETARDDGIALQLASGHSLRVAAASRVRIETDSVVLDAGAVYLDSGDGGHAAPLEVRSRLAVVHELGTQYMLRLAGGSLDVSVREGSVRVAQDGVVSSAIAGEMLHLDEAGHTQKLAIPEYGEYWHWVTQLAPVPTLEGMTLAEFLHWLVREQGWQLQFESPDLARDAGMVELHGSIDGLSGEDALSAVMKSTGWRYRLQDGALTIESRGAGSR